MASMYVGSFHALVAYGDVERGEGERLSSFFVIAAASPLCIIIHPPGLALVAL